MTELTDEEFTAFLLEYLEKVREILPQSYRARQMEAGGELANLVMEFESRFIREPANKLYNKGYEQGVQDLKKKLEEVGVGLLAGIIADKLCGQTKEKSTKTLLSADKVSSTKQPCVHFLCVHWRDGECTTYAKDFFACEWREVEV